ncbi:glutathione S-transferase family protein [Bradyrhizobium sp. LHD-71]|uniref:glutathione S-transferase family protein n=1 Tax=Bradyrhizobium sp. LHD-71 TaxID=3072141 RepID=UPI00280F00D9|nr:glutathione S-transferase family protein [Bradyrhizobium sp. LHD-71]MDQ8729063.1 glutathione S-transferase family protein [Bradyrhizobium sp. LHD-71]
MTRKLFELVGTDAGRPFSPYCWRTRMALVHKGLNCKTIPWRFTEKGAIAPYGSEKVPVLLDGETSVADSWAIANYLEDTYPERPSLFGGEGGRANARFLNSWGDLVIIAGIFPMIVADIPQHLALADRDYFRRTREARFNDKPLEQISADRDEKVVGFRRSLDPLRLMLRTQPFIGGAAPNYGDYIVFGGFQWARGVSPFKLLMQDDPVYAWRERMLDALGGIARASPGFAV